MSGTQSFLDKIIETKQQRLARMMSERPLADVRAAAGTVRRTATPHALLSALAHAGQCNIIAELKRASPSKGELRRELAPAAVARAYEAGGAAAISVLTEEDYFLGSLADLRAVRAAVALPVLRKDFIVGEWQVYETAAAGADALLLIVAALADETLAHLRRLTEDELGMDALVEVHTLDELRRAEACGARLVGVNNRNLHTFAVSLETSVELIAARQTDARFVSESGLRTSADLERLHALGFDGFLIGETFMRAAEPGAALRALREQAEICERKQL
ncbi:MAG TPA: indole-3-glycerol phosphate synthase TrpC [Pyrinomonadaceae bacterium]